MASIVEWAKGLERKQKKKPNKQLQQDVAEKIIEALTNRECSYTEAINVFVMFSSAVVQPFYTNYYWNMPEKMQTKWDHAFYYWATQNKPIVQAFSRMVLIIRVKLAKLDSCTSFEQELKWVAANINEKNAFYLTPLTKECKAADLRKLLEIDMSDWKYAKVQMEQLLAQIFEGREDKLSKEMYRDFLARHTKGQEEVKAPAAEHAAPQSTATAEVKGAEQEQPIAEVIKPLETAIKWGEEEKTPAAEHAAPQSTAAAEVKGAEQEQPITEVKKPLETAIKRGEEEKAPVAEHAAPQSTAAAEVKGAEQELPITEVKKSLETAVKRGEENIFQKDKLPQAESKLPTPQAVSVPKVEIPADGVMLAEALVKWAKAQKEKALEQTGNVSSLSAEVKKQCSQIETLTAQVAELTAAQAKLQSIQAELKDKLTATSDELTAVKGELAAANDELADAKLEIDTLRTEKEDAENIIGQIQQMSENSVKQELDGFKAKLAAALSSDVKDFRGEYSDEEKADVYAAFLEDMIDILKNSGIPVEEN